jgi:uncharacterized protein YgiM (DUF1202 family)
MKRTIISTLAAILITFFLPLHAASSNGYNSASNGIIHQDAHMRTGPGTDFSVITSLLQGTEIIKRQQQGQWAEVKVSRTGKTGWVHSSLVEETLTTTHVSPKILIGIIDIQRVLNESMQGHAAKKRIEHLKSNNEDIYVDLTIEEQILSGIIVEIQAVVEAYARSHGYTHILNKNSGSVFYYDDLYDITDDIIEEYDHQVDGNS